MPILLVEQRRIPWPSRAAAVVPVAGGLARRAQDRAQGDARQQYESVPVPHDIELLADVSEGAESREGDCGD